MTVWNSITNLFSGFKYSNLEKAHEEGLKNDAAKFVEASGTTVENDDDSWRKITGDSGRDLAPLTQKRMQHIAMYLWESNLLANRIIELPIAFILSQGVSVVCNDEEVQGWVDEFWHDPINQMDIKLITKARQLSLLGEQYYTAFTNEHNGHVRLGYLDPTQIATIVKDPDNNEQPIGVVTVKNRKGIAKRYKVIVNGPEDIFTQRTQKIRESFTDGEAFYFNINSFSNGDRGRSDLLAQADWMDAYDQFLYGEFDRAAFLRAFVWDVTLSNATPDEVKARAKEIHSPSPGSTRVHNDSEIWAAQSPGLQSGDTEATSKVFKEHMAGGATIPLHWLGSGGDANRATAAEMATPTFKIFEMRQTYLGYMLSQMVWFQIRMRAIAILGHEPDQFDEIFSFKVQWPNMVEADTTKYAAALSQVVFTAVALIDNQLLTKEKALQMVETITAKLGMEFDALEELEKATEEYVKLKEEDVFVEDNE